jgi:hypothetical protein
MNEAEATTNATPTNEPVKRGRGRPTSEVALRIQRKLRENGTVGIRYGETVGLNEAAARMRLYAAGRALGIQLRVTKAGSGATTRMVGTPRPATPTNVEDVEQ